jgi:hypothetical protein
MNDDDINQTAHRCLDAAADIDYLTLDDDSDEPIYECDPSELAQRAITIANRLFPDDSARIAASIRNFLELD